MYIEPHARQVPFSAKSAIRFRDLAVVSTVYRAIGSVRFSISHLLKQASWPILSALRQDEQEAHLLSPTEIAMKTETVESLGGSNAAVTILSVTERRQRLVSLLQDKFASSFFPLAGGIEYMHPEQRDALAWTGSIMEIASQDPIFRTAGLIEKTFGAFRKFFETSPEHVHAISCNCGGQVDGQGMANRLRQVGFI